MEAFFPAKLRIALLQHVDSAKFEVINNKTVLTGKDGELIKLLSRTLNFEYEILSPPDHSFGSEDEFGNWNGMMGMLARNEADMAFSYISMMAERLSVVDFSIPYDNFEKTFMMNRMNSNIHASFQQSDVDFILCSTPRCDGAISSIDFAKRVDYFRLLQILGIFFRTRN